MLPILEMSIYSAERHTHAHTHTDCFRVIRWKQLKSLCLFEQNVFEKNPKKRHRSKPIYQTWIRHISMIKIGTPFSSNEKSWIRKTDIKLYSERNALRLMTIRNQRNKERNKEKWSTNAFHRFILVDSMFLSCD